MNGRFTAFLAIMPLAAAVAFGQDSTLQAVTEISLFAEEEMVVTASKHTQRINEAPATVYVITEEDIRRGGYTDLEQIFHDIPGFDIARGYGTNYSQLYQRGFRSNNTNRTLLLIDGNEDNDIWSQIAWINPQYPLSNIKRIEVIHGPASVLYGANAFLGIINIITKSGEETNGILARSGAGSFETWFADVTTGKKLHGLDIALTGRFYRTDSDDLSRYPDWADSVCQDTSYQKEYAAGNYYLNRKIDYAIFGRAALGSVDGSFSIWETRESFGAWYRARYEVTKGTVWHQRNMRFHVGHKWSPRPALFFDTKAIYLVTGVVGDSRSIYEGSQTYWETRNNSLRLEEQVSWSPVERWKAALGLQYDMRQVTLDYDTSSVSPYPGVERWQLLESHQQGLYLENDIDVNDGINLTLGTRYDQNSLFGGVFNPRMGIVLLPTHPLYVKFLYGRAYQAPTPWEKYSHVQTRVPNPDLTPERVQTFEFILGNRWPRLQTELSFFTSDFTNIIQTVKFPDSVDVDGDGTIDWGKDQHRNLGRRLIYGLEFQAKYRFSGSNEVYLNYSYLNPWDLNTNTRVGDISEHKANAGCTFSIIDRLGGMVRANLVGPRTTVPTNPVRRVAGYSVCHLILTYRDLFERLDCQLMVNNLFDREYFDPGVRTADGDYYASLLPQPRRHLMAAVSYKL